MVSRTSNRSGLTDRAGIKVQKASMLEGHCLASRSVGVCVRFAVGDSDRDALESSSHVSARTRSQVGSVVVR